VLQHDTVGDVSTQSLSTQQKLKVKTVEKRLGNQTDVTRPKNNDMSFLVGQSQKKRSTWQDAFEKSTNVLQDGVTTISSFDKPNKIDASSFVKSEKGDIRVSRGVSARNERTCAKLKTDRKVKELQGNGNPIYHNHCTPFNMPQTGRMKSLATCFGSSGMKDSLDVKFYKNWELKAAKNIGDSYVRESVNKTVTEKPKGGAWVQPKTQRLTFQ
jgi:hypothetical protein